MKIYAAMAESIVARLDREAPAHCLACSTPYKRGEAKWIDFAFRNVCPACGLDQASAEAGAIVRSRL